MTDLFLGLDLGTSGVRSAVVDADGAVIAEARAAYPQQGDPLDAEGWWTASEACLAALVGGMEGSLAGAVRAMAVCATSGSMVLVDGDIRPVTPGLMYDSGGFDAEAAVIARHAEAGSITRGTGSALARMLRLQSHDPDRRARFVTHQADFVLGRLTGIAGVSDENNTLKLGYDPDTGGWPGWLAQAGVLTDLLPNVHRPGAAVGPIAPTVADRLGLPPTVMVRAGTTDSIGAFLAAGATAPGEAVTSLGTTLVVKLVSDVRVNDPARGIYSHRLNGRWLAGGASNTGGGALVSVFPAGAIARLSGAMDPNTDTGLDYYPLARPGERFPVADPALQPRMTPRPEDDTLYLQGLLEGIARIESDCYAALANLGAPMPVRILTAGGGAANAAWTAIRRRILGVDVSAAPQTEAAVGMALLCRDAHSRG